MNNISSEKNGIYVKARDKYNDMKSSAFCLIFVGLIGLIVIVLDYTNLLPFKLNASKDLFFYIVMFALFAIFIIAGIFTIKSAKKINASIPDEESQTDSIITWAIENLTAEHIDNLCSAISSESLNNDTLEGSPDEVYDDFSKLPDEAKYLLRIEVMEKLILENSDTTDKTYIASIIDEIYPELFD